MSQTTRFHDATSLLSSASFEKKENDSSRVTSVSDFIKKIVQLNKEAGTEVFYRGHADASWDLKPSIFRKPNGVEIEHQLFRDMVAHTPQSFSGCKSALDYLVQMQHYELPTRLLDVSTNPLIALHFACAQIHDVELEFLSRAIGGIMEGALCQYSPAKPYSENIAIGMAGAVAGALAAIAPEDDAEKLAVIVVTAILKALSKEKMSHKESDALVSETLKKALLEAAKKALSDATKKVVSEAAKRGAEIGAKTRGKDGVVYLFSIPEDRVKHYDSDTVSVLANLAKCNDHEIDINTVRVKGEIEGEELKRFNEGAGIRILLSQIKEEKPYFDPLIRPNDLSSIFLVKAKYGNPRIINQAGAFFIFGLGLNPSFRRSGGRLIKRGDHQIPSNWIRHKFIIPKDKKQDILDELARMGITESYLFPEMDRYAKELKKKYKLE